MHFIHQFLSSWFGFNKQQRNGIIVLCFLILILFIIRISLNLFIKPDSILIADFSSAKLPHFQDSKSQFTKDSFNQTQTNLFVFDPNTVTKEQLISLGLKEKTANTFLNYRSKGGQFKYKEDVKKIYGMNEELYIELEPYIFIRRNKTNLQEPSSNTLPSKNKQLKTIEINSADSMMLLPLPGIGPSFAKRIIKYRTLLGGYSHMEQIREVYGFTDSLFYLIKPYLIIDPNKIVKIDLNTENFKALNAHPYISYEETKAIFNYRRKNGSITKTSQLKEILSENTFQKLLPYLELEN